MLIMFVHLHAMLPVIVKWEWEIVDYAPRRVRVCCAFTGRSASTVTSPFRLPCHLLKLNVTSSFVILLIFCYFQLLTGQFSEDQSRLGHLPHRCFRQDCWGLLIRDFLQAGCPSCYLTGPITVSEHCSSSCCNVLANCLQQLICC